MLKQQQKESHQDDERADAISKWEHHRSKSTEMNRWDAADWPFVISSIRRERHFEVNAAWTGRAGRDFPSDGTAALGYILWSNTDNWPAGRSTGPRGRSFEPWSKIPDIRGLGICKEKRRQQRSAPSSNWALRWSVACSRDRPSGLSFCTDRTPRDLCGTGRSEVSPSRGKRGTRTNAAILRS